MYYRFGSRSLKKWTLWNNKKKKWKNGIKNTRKLKTCKTAASKQIKRWHIHFGLFYLTVTSKSLVWFYYCFSTVLQYSNANRLQVEIRCAVGSGFKLSAKPCPQPLPVLFFNTRYKWVMGETLVFLNLVSCISARNECKKAVCEENSQIQKTCWNAVRSR